MLPTNDTYGVWPKSGEIDVSLPLSDHNHEWTYTNALFRSPRLEETTTPTDKWVVISSNLHSTGDLSQLSIPTSRLGESGSTGRVDIPPLLGNIHSNGPTSISLPVRHVLVPQYTPEVGLIGRYRQQGHVHHGPLFLRVVLEQRRLSPVLPEWIGR